MATTLNFDPSRPCQVSDELLALWLPRGRGRDALADGLIATVDVCENPACPCTIATLQAHRIDDRAERAVLKDHKLRTTWRVPPGGPPRPEGDAVLKVDITTGEVTDREHGKPPATFTKFFEEPLPFWVLDAIWARWRAPRLPSGIDWKKQALDRWEPGALLPTMFVYPEERPDRYIADGKVYQVDMQFCVEPSCDCTEALFMLLALSDDAKRLDSIGAARLPLQTMTPVGFNGEKRDLEVFVHVYMEWRRRNVPAKDRLLELRDMTRRRGLELHKLFAARSQSAARPQPAAPARSTASHSRPGRNDPCSCGSGRKYKRCCGR